MAVSKDLLLSILSMDAYNREYGVGIEISGSEIGNATIKDHEQTGVTPSEYQAWQDAGFYAVAYDLDGETIISYRGTDFSPFSDLKDDALKGWFIGGGDYTAAQAKLSVDFLDAVQIGNGSDVTLTGHSLGGGLAGFNSRLFGNKAVVFDNMPYLQAVDNLVEYYTADEGIFDSIDPIITLSGVVISKETAKEVAREIYRASLSPLPFEQYEAGQIALHHNTTGYYMPGEVLDHVGFSFLNFNIVRDRDDYPTVIPAGLTDKNTNIAHAPGLDANVSLHSMSALVLQLFSDEQGHSEKWLPIHEQVFGAWFSDEIAEAIKPADISTYPEGFTSGTVLTAIAYSALDEGSLVFGDTGIRAMFDDANELGRMYSKENHDSFLDEKVFHVGGGRGFA